MKRATKTKVTFKTDEQGKLIIEDASEDIGEQHDVSLSFFIVLNFNTSCHVYFLGFGWTG